MSFKNLFIKHERTLGEQEWLDEEIAEQEMRFEKIEQQMNDLAPKREKWYLEFFDRITTSGFNVDGDNKVLIEKKDLPVKPEVCEDKVIWKYGIDGE